MSDEEMTQLLEAAEDRLGGSWVDTIEWLKSSNDVDDIASRLRAGDIDGAVSGVEAAATRIGAAIQAEYITAGEAAAAFVDDIKPGKLVTFDSTNQRAADWATTNRADLVREVTAEQRRVIAQVVGRGNLVGTNPRVMARDIRDSIGLTEEQERHVASYRKALEDGDWSNALGRKLRDGRSDKTLRRLMADGEAMTQAQIDSMVSRYHANYVAHRAEVIARTEALRALHEGVDEGFQQAIDNGDIAADELVQEWHSAADGRVRDSHTHVRSDSGEVTKPIGVGYWVTKDGNTLRYPGDPTAPAEEIVQCRCVVSTVINPNVLPTTTAPAGFDDRGRQVREGIPKADDIRELALYRVPVDDLRGKLLAPPGVDETQNQTESIRQAWRDGRKLPPLKLTMLDDGTYFVVDGRHRLQAALEQGRDVLVEFGSGSAAPFGSVPLTTPASE